jgi:hypothetical protein
MQLVPRLVTLFKEKEVVRSMAKDYQTHEEARTKDLFF